MPHVVVIHKVQDYDRWRPHFDSHASTQRAAGLTVRHVLRSADDPQEVVVFFDAEDLGRARELAGSEDLRKIMQEAGVLGPPAIHFLEATSVP